MPNFCAKFSKNVFLTDPDLEFWIRLVSRSVSGSAVSVAALARDGHVVSNVHAYNDGFNPSVHFLGIIC